jgi:hypothetical protein
VIFGSGRPHIGVLLSPAPNYRNLLAVEFVELVWPRIQMTNLKNFKQTRIPREAIIMEKENKPFVLTDKRTVRSQATRELYDNEIEQVYKLSAQALRST